MCVSDFPEYIRRNPFIEEIIAFIAIPDKMILFDDKKFVYLPLSPLEMKNIINVAPRAVMNEIGVIRKKLKLGSKKYKIAPSPAPEEIPNNPGSAKLFLSNVCNIIPEQLNAAPIKNALSVLGNRISNIIFEFIGFELKISNGETITLPIDIDNKKDTINPRNKNINIFKFMFI